MTTETTTRKYHGEVPPWLNIDLLIDESTLSLIDKTLEQFRQDLPAICKSLYLARSAIMEFNDRTKDDSTGDDVALLLRELTGLEELWDMVQLVEGIAGESTGCGISGEQVTELESRFLG